MLIAADWGSALTALLPFVLLLVFWVFIRERIRKENPQQQTLEKLDEIREELIRLRKSIESRP